MTQTDLILIISIVSIVSTLGIYVGIKCIKQYTTNPVNVLSRRGRGDIELNDLNEPTQPLQTYFPNKIDHFSSYPCELEREIGIQTSNNLPLEVAIQTSNNLPIEVAIQTSNDLSSTGSQPIPSFFHEFIYSPLENENIFYSNLINYLLENNLDFILWIILFSMAIILTIVLLKNKNKQFFNKNY